MAIDTSALVAILLHEPEADRFLDLLDASTVIMWISPVSVFEAREAVRFAL